MISRFWFVLLLFVFTTSSQACPGPESEVAQEQDASVLFEGTLIAYERGDSVGVPGVTSGSLAKVSFDVTKTIRGEKRKRWVVVMRGTDLPKSLSSFTNKFGSLLKVGIRDFGSVIDQTKLPKGYRDLLFVVDAACSMNSEDWRLRRI